jgi:Outer membrane protein beta-barrel domain
MKVLIQRILLIGFCLLIGFSATAQDDQKEKKEPKGGRDRLVIDLNWNGWITKPDDINVKWYGRGIGLYFMYDMPFGNSPFSIAPGFGLGSDNIFHNGLFSQDTISGTTFLKPIPDTITYNNNKLNTTYLEVPLEIRYRSEPDSKNRSFKVAIGFKAGFLLQSYVKYSGNATTFGIPRDDAKIRHYRVPNINDIRYGLTFRVGYGPFNLKAFYSLSTLFKQGLGPEIVPLNIGISFNGL